MKAILHLQIDVMYKLIKIHIQKKISDIDIGANPTGHQDANCLIGSNIN